MIQRRKLALLATVAVTVSAFGQNEATEGKWEPAVLLLPSGYTQPTQAVHTVLLKNNKLLVWDQSQNQSPNKCDTLLIDLSTQPTTVSRFEEAGSWVARMNRQKDD